MNPLVHAELAWLTGARLAARRDRVLVTLAGVAPDLDGLTILFGEEAYGRWHHVVTHGALSAVSLCAALAAFGVQRGRVLGLGLFAFHLHLLCDLAGSGPGWPIFYLWPFSSQELMWSGQWDLASWQNAVIGLSATLACLAMAKWLNRTIVELFSLRGDAAVVKTIRARFG